MDKENSIGILNERTLHLALKNFIEPDCSFHEKQIGRFIADIERDGNITEIETVSFTNIKRKLPYFLKDHRVTVVYPIPYRKWIVRTDRKSGEVVGKRKSPKTGRAVEAFREIYQIREYINDPGFMLKIVMTEEINYRLCDPGADRKRYGSIRTERIPTDFVEVIDIKAPEDYVKLLKEIPTGEFTSSVFARSNGITVRLAWYVIKVLLSAGIIELTGKRGKAYIYCKKDRITAFSQ